MTQPPSDPAAEAEIALRERLCLIQKCITLAERDGLADCVIRGSVLQWKAILADIAALRTARDTLANDLAESRAEVARLSETYTDDRGNCWSPPTAWAYFAACRALNAKRARIDELEAALKPFAILAAELNDSDVDSGHLWESPTAMSMTAGDIRHAARALNPEGASDT